MGLEGAGAGAGAELGAVSASMRGTVVKGELIEAVLGTMPEQVWAWDEDIPGIPLLPIEVPMAKRREIVATILIALAP